MCVCVCVPGAWRASACPDRRKKRLVCVVCWFRQRLVEHKTRVFPLPPALPLHPPLLPPIFFSSLVAVVSRHLSVGVHTPHRRLLLPAHATPMRPKHTSHAARYAAALLFMLLALPSMRTTASSALHGFLGSAVALPFGVGKWASLGLFALQVLVDGNAAPVDGREARLLEYVVQNSNAGDLEGALASSIAYQQSHEFFMSVGQDKGKVSREERVGGRVETKRAASLAWKALAVAGGGGGGATTTPRRSSSPSPANPWPR